LFSEVALMNACSLKVISSGGCCLDLQRDSFISHTKAFKKTTPSLLPNIGETLWSSFQGRLIDLGMRGRIIFRNEGSRELAEIRLNFKPLVHSIPTQSF